MNCDCDTNSIAMMDCTEFAQIPYIYKKNRHFCWLVHWTVEFGILIAGYQKLIFKKGTGFILFMYGLFFAIIL
jgi:hypothetical protein